MNGTTGVLPYRVDVDELAGWVEGRARGRSAVQLKAAFGAKTVEGLTATAAALGLVADDGELTSRGGDFALAPAASRPSAIRAALFAFRPYAELFEEVRARGHLSTDAPWVEAWWATRGYGNSPSNRREGVATLGRLVEYAGLGRYIAGRRGHQTRIEWSAAGRAIAERVAESARPAEPIRGPGAASSADLEAGAEAPVAVAAGGSNRVVVFLAEGLRAELDVPARLPRSEKRRLLELLDLLVVED